MCGAIRSDEIREVAGRAGRLPGVGQTEAATGCVVVEGEVEDEVHPVSLARDVRGNWPPGVAQSQMENAVGPPTSGLQTGPCAFTNQIRIEVTHYDIWTIL